MIGYISWFRSAGPAANNPVTLDPTTAIDSTTFTRNENSLPPGDNSPASANREVAAALGLPDTQAVMYSAIQSTQRWTALSADDVNMVLMANTGADRLANTSDDYTVEFVFEPNCVDADIRVSFDSITGLAECDSDIDRSFPQPGPSHRHWSLITQPFDWVFILLNENRDWSILLFEDGFESGNTSAWSATAP